MGRKYGASERVWRILSGRNKGKTGVLWLQVENRLWEILSRYRIWLLGLRLGVAQPQH